MYVLIFCFTDPRYGVFAGKMCSPGEFLLEYPAELVTYEETLEREKVKQYETFMKYFLLYTYLILKL